VEVIADCGEHGVDGVACAVSEMITTHAAYGLPGNAATWRRTDRRANDVVSLPRSLTPNS
jgi:hypothetical protein